jgi:hypothetical protein
VAYWVRVLASVTVGTGDTNLGANFVKHISDVLMGSQEMKGRNATRKKKIHIFAVARQ